MDEAQVQRDDVPVRQGVNRKLDGVLSRGSLSGIPRWGFERTENVLQFP